MLSNFRNNDIHKVFERLDIVLFFSGVKSNVSNRFVSLLNLFFRAAIVVSCYYVCVLHVLTLCNGFDLFFFAFVLIPLVTMILHHRFWYKISVYRRFRLELCNAVALYTNNDNKYNKFFSFFAAWLFIGGSSTMIVYFNVMGDDTKQKRQMISSATTSDNAVVHWINTTTMYYAYMFGSQLFMWFTVAYCASLSNLSRLHEQFLVNCCNVVVYRNVNRIVAMRNKLRQLYALFHDLFDICPLIWCAVMYSLVSGLIVMFVKVRSGEKWSLIMDTVSLYSTEVFIFLTLLASATIAENMNKRRLQVLEHLKDVAHFNKKSARLGDIHYVTSCVKGLKLSLTGKLIC